MSIRIETAIPNVLEDSQAFQAIIEKVSEGDGLRLASEVLSKRNFLRGFLAAQEATSLEELQDWFDQSVACEYSGPWAPKKAALDGIRYAAVLGFVSHIPEEAGLRGPIDMEILFVPRRKHK